MCRPASDSSLGKETIRYSPDFPLEWFADLMSRPQGVLDLARLCLEGFRKTQSRPRMWRGFKPRALRKEDMVSMLLLNSSIVARHTADLAVVA